MRVPEISFERLLVDPTGFNLTTASPLQLALTRAADGRPIGAGLDDAGVERHFGCERSRIGLVAPTLVVVVAGVRGGKSLLASCAAVRSCLDADLSGLKPHEIPRFAIVAPSVDNARVVFQHLTGSVMASPRLSRMVVGKSATIDVADGGRAKPTVDTLVLRRPDGRVLEIVVVAAGRGGITLRSRWLVGFVFDECALFGSEIAGAAVNAESLLHAAEPRLLPGAQGWLISSPYGPQGLLYEMYKEHFGNPGEVLVCHAPTRALNPSYPEAKIEALRRRRPDVAAREHE